MKSTLYRHGKPSRGGGGSIAIGMPRPPPQSMVSTRSPVCRRAPTRSATRRNASRKAPGSDLAADMGRQAGPPRSPAWKPRAHITRPLRRSGDAEFVCRSTRRNFVVRAGIYVGIYPQRDPCSLARGGCEADSIVSSSALSTFIWLMSSDSARSSSGGLADPGVNDAIGGDARPARFKQLPPLTMSAPAPLLRIGPAPLGCRSLDGVMQVNVRTGVRHGARQRLYRARIVAAE